MDYINTILTGDEEEVIRYFESLFMRKGYPTEEYKYFLMSLPGFLLDATSEQRQHIHTFLTHCQEGAYLPIYGIVHIKPEEPYYKPYSRILHAIYGEQCQFMNKVSAQIGNVILMHMILQLEKGCSYHPCYRNNALHKECMHKQLQLQL
jgi:hypothetical protein